MIFWGDVFLQDGRDDEKLAIYIMDTQGLFDHRTTTADNSRIFSLSTLISSVQILNLFNVIQENQLQYLQFATEYARYASVDSEQSPFQNLLILIRDWNSPSEYSFGLRGGKSYLDEFLEINDHQSSDLKSVRKYLRSSFEKLECFLMPHPGKKVATDHSYDGRWDDIDDDFVTMMNELFEHLFKKLKPKTINGNPVRPDELVVFINSYIQNFNNDSTPEPNSIYESTLENQFRIVVAKSIDIYIDTVSQYDAELTSEQEINTLHQSAKDKAIKNFASEKKFGTYSEGANFKKDLIAKVEQIFKQWKAVSLVQLRKLQEQKSKTNAQVQQVQEAQINDDKAKEALEMANSKAEAAKMALISAKQDTAQARHEAQELKRKFEEAELLRADAIEKERQTHEWLQKMSKEKGFYEQEYNKLRETANMNVGTTLNQSQEKDGFLGKI